MKRAAPLLWPLLVAVVSLGATGWLWSHERQTTERTLRHNFEFGLRQAGSRIQERVTSYEQMLRGLRGLFDASDLVRREDFERYVDSLSAGPDFAGLRTVAYAPLRAIPGAPPQAPLTYAAPALDASVRGFGDDLLADPARSAAMMVARDSGGMAITQALRDVQLDDPVHQPRFVLCMALYAKGQAHDTVAMRRAQVVGWVLAGFRIDDLLSSVYGEGTPGLDVRVHDGVTVEDATRLYPASLGAAAGHAARFEAQEYIAFAGHTWTLMVRSSPEFERQFGNDSARIIALAGTGLSVVLALLTWQLVTGRDRAQAAAREMTRQVRESSQRYRRIVETADEGIWMVDANGCTTFVNPKLQQMLGYQADELVGRSWLEFTDEAGRAALIGDGATEPGRPMHERLELSFRRRDGTPMWTMLSTSATLDESGRPAGALAMVTDITAQRAAEANRDALEAQLRQSQKMEAIGTLAGGVAHDFNNILAAILGHAALIAQDLGTSHDADAAAGRLEQIRRAGERGRSLVQQIVAFSRQQPQQRVNQPLRPLLEEAARLMRAALPALVQIELDLSDEPLNVSADATQLQQVFMNLCTNAWHAMEGGTGRIAIGLDAIERDAATSGSFAALPAGRYARVCVQDNGRGMDEATRARIFEPFFTTKPVGQGTGLGLSVVHGIVASHGGAIEVRSAPGSGSMFEMLFPLAAQGDEPVAAPPAEAAVARGQGQHVVYVDDDPVMLIMVEALLQRAGFRVTCTDDPHRGVALAGVPGSPVDLVVTDFNMPVLSGLDLARQLQGVRPELPVILTSGFITDSLRNEATRAGVCQVLQKEFTLEQLVGAVHRALSERASVAPIA